LKSALSWPVNQFASRPLPLVSVAIPCHNSASFVGDAIRSALEQSWKPIEIVVVDDASSDESLSVVSSFDEQVKVISLAVNKGAAFARNRAAEACSGDFILFLDADDLLGVDAVTEMVEVSLSHQGQIAACRFSYLVPDDVTWKCVPARPRRYSNGDQLLAWLEGNWSPPCALLWSREAYQSVGGWNESLTRNDDGDIAMRALSRGIRIVAAEGGEVFYRRHKGTRVSVSTTRKSESHLKSGVQVLTDLAAELARQGRLEKYARAVREDLAELALLAFRAGLDTLGRETVAMARSLSSVRTPSDVGVSDPRTTKHEGRSAQLDLIYAVSVRAHGQLRRWLKRKSS
jgi:glycosyltransferase involved in cell wall biosynthesis